MAHFCVEPCSCGGFYGPWLLTVCSEVGGGGRGGTFWSWCLELAQDCSPTSQGSRQWLCCGDVLCTSSWFAWLEGVIARFFSSSSFFISSFTFQGYWTKFNQTKILVHQGDWHNIFLMKETYQRKILSDLKTKRS